jgi:hypothetical protein
MTAAELNRIAVIAREAGEHEIADKLELEATQARENEYDKWWAKAYDNDTADLY